jgi:hypothetical protein
MKQYGLGPNGGIVTSLNLFATRFDQIMDYCAKREKQGGLRHIFLDTPGQIEVCVYVCVGVCVCKCVRLCVLSLFLPVSS